MKFAIIILLSFISLPVFSQSDSISSLNLGDPAPQIRVSNWLKGSPVDKFEKGKIYVVEFWGPHGVSPVLHRCRIFLN